MVVELILICKAALSIVGCYRKIFRDFNICSSFFCSFLREKAVVLTLAWHFAG
jgi:hypothetical protein